MRSLAGAMRSAARLALVPIDRMIEWRHGGLIPPAHLRLYYYRSWKLAVFTQVCQNVRHELVSRGLRPEHRLLDIGSGIGNLALGLVGYLRGGYDGVEIHPEAVAWCQRAITSRHPSFRFHRADLSSVAYNPGGSGAAAGYRFPFPDAAFDFVFLGSVFTHLLPDAVEQYVHEISRLLAPHGTCVASYFLLNDEARAGVDRGSSFISFPVAHPSGVCRLHDPSIQEAAVALEEGFVGRIHREAGLSITHVRRGQWWSGLAHDQDVLTVRHDGERQERLAITRE